MLSNTVGRGAYRGPWQFESVARELLLDIAARQLGIDPIELRRRNLLRRDELPYSSATGFVYDHVTPMETFEHALEVLDYDTFRRWQAEARAARRYLGVGTCTFIEPTSPGYGVYRHGGCHDPDRSPGTITVYVAGGSSGNSIETTVVQLVADTLDVDIADVATVQGDTAVTPAGAGACGSRSASMTAGAVAETATLLREKIRSLAAQLFEAAEEDLELIRGRVSVRGHRRSASRMPSSRTWPTPSEELPPGTPVGLEASARYTAAAPQVWTNATHVCTCEVDVTTGVVRLLRYIVSEDCGPMINPAVVEGQIAGGTAQGIGAAVRAPRVRRRRESAHRPRSWTTCCRRPRRFR